MLATPSKTRWTWVPLGAALTCVLLAVLSMGAGILLAPISVALSILALRCGANTRSMAFVLGIAANAIVSVLFLSAIVIFVYDSV